MKELINFTFDFFGHVLPGIVIIISFSLFFIDTNSLDFIKEQINTINTANSTLIAISAYIVGFALDPIGKLLYKKIGFKIWNLKVQNGVDMFISNKFALVREFSEKNFKYVEKWNMYCTMSYNFALASIFVFLSSIFKVFQEKENYLFWLLIIVLSLFLFFIFLYKAVLFSIWAAHDLNATITALKLEEKVSKE